MDKLKPCPFCGGQVKLKMLHVAMIQCTKCNAIISFGGNEYPKQTVKMYNLRTESEVKK